MISIDRKELMEHYKLTDEKIDKMVSRAILACLAYKTGEMSLKQVWYRARGERFIMACQFYPDHDVGGSLWELANDFYTCMDCMDHVIIDSIFRVIKSVKTNKNLIQ
ncbi:MAG: hypothetical protein JRJ87_23840 [Deltaproteobacteria bacterium]|nr:hypothetical protein [Deltaproteobacteria bacterium]